MRPVAPCVLAIAAALPASAQTIDDEAKVRSVIADWYDPVADARKAKKF